MVLAHIVYEPIATFALVELDAKLEDCSDMLPIATLLFPEMFVRRVQKPNATLLFPEMFVRRVQKPIAVLCEPVVLHLRV